MSAPEMTDAASAPESVTRRHVPARPRRLAWLLAALVANADRSRRSTAR